VNTRPLSCFRVVVVPIRVFIRFVGRLITVLALASVVACSFQLPRVHKIVIQQGNVITQEMVDRLKPGMTRRQVAFVMGEPVLKNDFTPNRWDYVYSVQLPNQPPETHRLSLFFEDEVLAYFTGDFAPTNAQTTNDTASAAPPLPEASPEGAPKAD
jgi:outer membrane protein assembly factor BamE